MIGAEKTAEARRRLGGVGESESGLDGRGEGAGLIPGGRGSREDSTTEGVLSRNVMAERRAEVWERFEYSRG